MESLLSAEIPKHWYGEDAFVSHFFDALSSTFPFGESFFVRSVNNYRSEIKDPDLIRAVRDFAGQEGQHSRQHDDHMKLLLDQGYAMLERRNRILDRFMKWHTRKTPRFALAVTASIEHLTALLARQLLSDPARWTEPMHPDMARLWRWHALEEAEHKAVTYDVLMQVAPSRLRRNAVMVMTTLELSFEVFVRTAYMLHKDGLLFDRAVWSKGLRFLFGQRGFLRGQGKEYAAFYGATFHPNDVDDSALIEKHAPLIALEIAS
ncbi:MAG: metal-dependent hydrolase [Myxococcota bacterium]